MARGYPGLTLTAGLFVSAQKDEASLPLPIPALVLVAGEAILCTSYFIFYSRPMKAVTDFSGAIISVSIRVSPILLQGRMRKKSFCNSNGISP